MLSISAHIPAHSHAVRHAMPLIPAQDKTEVKRWAADKRGVSALCYGPTADTPTLISAGAQIKVWNLTTYTELKVRRCRKKSTNAASRPLPHLFASVVMIISHPQTRTSQRINGHEAGVAQLMALSVGPSYVMSLARPHPDDTIINLWTLASGDKVRRW